MRPRARRVRFLLLSGSNVTLLQHPGVQGVRATAKIRRNGNQVMPSGLAG